MDRVDTTMHLPQGVQGTGSSQAGVSVPPCHTCCMFFHTSKPRQLRKYQTCFNKVAENLVHATVADFQNWVKEIVLFSTQVKGFQVKSPAPPL